MTRHDAVPADKKQKYGESLREKEQKVQAEIVQAVDASGGNMSVASLMERYINLKWDEVKETTRNGYRTQLKFIKSDPMGKRRIKTLNATDAEEWLIELHKKQGKSYSTLHTLRGILRPAFAMAKRNRWTVDNPFDFPMNQKKYGGSKTRDALSKADMRRFLDFVRTDKHFSRYFEGTYILFHTGLRISEFCGLTADDIDFEENVIHVRRQLLRIHDGDTIFYYIDTPKTENGSRDVPMTPDVETCFRKVIADRPILSKEMIVWDTDHKESVSGFLWLDKNQNVEVAQHWSNHLRWARAKFNRIYKDEIPEVTPHVCRHTFCSNCASLGMSPKTLQLIMGHASIEFTLNVYTHLEPGDIKGQFMSIMTNPQYTIYPLDRKPAVISLDDSAEEGEPDLDAEPDDDEA